MIRKKILYRHNRISVIVCSEISLLQFQLGSGSLAQQATSVGYISHFHLKYSGPVPYALSKRKNPNSSLFLSFSTLLLVSLKYMKREALRLCKSVLLPIACLPISGKRASDSILLKLVARSRRTVKNPVLYLPWDYDWQNWE